MVTPASLADPPFGLLFLFLLKHTFKFKKQNPGQIDWPFYVVLITYHFLKKNKMKSSTSKWNKRYEVI